VHLGGAPTDSDGLRALFQTHTLPLCAFRRVHHCERTVCFLFGFFSAFSVFQLTKPETRNAAHQKDL
jgi:hypothetical protein